MREYARAIGAKWYIDRAPETLPGRGVRNYAIVRTTSGLPN